MGPSTNTQDPFAITTKLHPLFHRAQSLYVTSRHMILSCQPDVNSIINSMSVTQDLVMSVIRLSHHQCHISYPGSITQAQCHVSSIMQVHEPPTSFRDHMRMHFELSHDYDDSWALLLRIDAPTNHTFHSYEWHHPPDTTIYQLRFQQLVFDQLYLT